MPTVLAATARLLGDERMSSATVWVLRPEDEEEEEVTHSLKKAGVVAKVKAAFGIKLQHERCQ